MVQDLMTVFTPLLHAIDQKKIDIKSYEYGTRGPAELDDFINRIAGYKRAGTYNVSLKHSLVG